MTRKLQVSLAENNFMHAVAKTLKVEKAKIEPENCGFEG